MNFQEYCNHMFDKARAYFTFFMKTFLSFPLDKKSSIRNVLRFWQKLIVPDKNREL